MASTKTANYFSQIFTSTFTADISDDESRQKEYEEKKKLLHRQKYVPAVKAENELFDSNLHVNAGPEFMENYGSQHDGNIVVSCNNARLTNIRYPSNFEECNFTRQIIENIKRKNFNDPTQVQKAMILLIKGLEYDIVGRAQTGSGKTAAFLLPIIDELHREYIQGIAQFNSDSPYAIIIAPTRELVNQIYEDTCTFSKDTSIKVAVAYGDVPMEFSIRELHKGCDILCSTIGRLCHYTKEQIIRLDKVRYFIIDEADWFLSQQRSDTIEDIRYINSLLPQKHRTFMMSATFDERSELAAKQFLHEKYVFVHIPQTINTISHKFLKVDKFSKMSVLINLLKGRSTLNESDGLYDTEKTIVFKNGRRECDRLGVALSYYGYRAITINRNRTMQQRRDAVDKFTMGIYNIVVSTDIIGRGLNFPNVEHVINFDLPKFEDYNQYIHRVGRTGRTGNFGCATSFFDVTSLSDTSAALFYAKTLEDLKQPVPDFLISIIRFQQEIKEEYQRQNQPNATLSHKGNNADMESAEQMKNILW